MNEPNSAGSPAFFRNIPRSFLRLWHARGELRLKSIRKETLRYILAFPLMMLFINFEYKYFIPDTELVGFRTSLLLPLAFCVGSLAMLFVKERRFAKASHIAAVIMVVGFLVRFLPFESLHIYGALVCWLCVGACGIGAWLYFCVKLNNTERMFGILLEVIIVNAYFLIEGGVRATHLLGVIVTSVIILGLALCAVTFRYKDALGVAPPDEGAKPRSGNYWGLVYAITYFIILQFFNEYIATPMAFSDFTYAIGGLLAAAIALIIQLSCKRSAWQIWNVLILSAVLAAVFLWIPANIGITTGSLFVGLFSYSGDIVLFYTCAGVIKRYYSYRFFRRFLLGFYAALVAAFMLTGLTSNLGEQELLVVISVFVGVVFAVFLLLSPTLYDKLFAAEWAGEFHEPDMSLPEAEAPKPNDSDRMEGYGLTPREREICALLLTGHTLRQISAELGIGFSTVNTHYKNLYRKLNINSRVELLLLFGIKTG